MKSNISQSNHYYFLWFLYFISSFSFGQIRLETPNFIRFNIENNTILEAGSDFKNQQETSVNGIILSVNILPNDTENVFYKNWHIDINRNDIDWHSNLILQIKRTGNGSSDFGKTLNNGEIYQNIELNPTTLFSGSGWVNNIPLQLQLSGISAVLPAKSYATEIILTLIDD
jgi:hypothetical protein